MNNGAWSHVDRRLEAVLIGLDMDAKRPRYVGRDEAASPATGQARAHAMQQTALVQEALQ
jgi:2-oxoglutarate dehydrogenase E1 component